MNERQLDKIFIKNLEVFGRHGVLPEENRLGQKFIINAALYLSTREAGLKDNLTNTIHYGDVSRFMTSFMTEHTYQLIEAAAGQDYSFGQLCEMASKETISSLVDCNDDCFLAPESMIQAVKEFCEKEGQQVPETPAQLGAVIYNSLAKCYGETVKELEQVTGKHYGQVHIVGGGANADYLNRLTAVYTGRPVFAGPTEATAIGNLAAQMIRAGEYKSLAEARQGIFQSFEIKRY